MGDALDLLATGEPFGVLLAVQTSSGEVKSYEFEDDGPEACLEAARARVGEVAGAKRYALVYEGATGVRTGAASIKSCRLPFSSQGFQEQPAQPGPESESCCAVARRVPARISALLLFLIPPRSRARDRERE